MRPRTLTPPKKRRRPRTKHLIISLFVLCIVACYVAIAITRPFNELSPQVASSDLTITTPAGDLPWPAYGQGAVGLADGTVIAQHGEQTQLPIASAAKVVTALMVLERHPLTTSTDGPTLTMSDRDVEIYKQYIAKHGSVTAVATGQKLTERDMLEALLLPSANNIADSLAIWSYGSVDNYISAANAYLKNHGLVNTTVGGDASGYLPDSTSTAVDLVKLGGLAMNQPVIAQIVAQKTATIPGTGTVTNYNSLLGNNGIVGIKTGNNDQNTGVFVGASNLDMNGKTVTIISALSGAPALSTVLRDSNDLLAAARSTFAKTTIVRADSVMGTYRQFDGSLLQAVASDDLVMTIFRGTTIKAHIKLQDISYNTPAGQTVGYVSVPANQYGSAQAIPIKLKQIPAKPGLMYRLLHP